MFQTSLKFISKASNKSLSSVQICDHHDDRKNGACTDVAPQIVNATSATSSMVITSKENMEFMQKILQPALNNTMYNLLSRTSYNITSSIYY